MVDLPDEIRNRNRKDSAKYGKHFIDMIAMSQNDDGRIHCFTDDNRSFTIDYGHLSRPGAQCYARMIEKNGIFCKKFTTSPPFEVLQKFHPNQEFHIAYIIVQLAKASELLPKQKLQSL